MVRIAIACIASLVAISGTAFAQAPASVLVACQGAGNCPTGGHNSPYTDLQQAIDDAVSDAVTLNQQVTLLVAGGPWIGTFTIPADANVHILGIQFNLQQTVTIVNPGAPPVGGTFTLSFTDLASGTTTTTPGLPANATAAAVQTALEALTGIGAGNVTVTGPGGGPYDVDFSAGALSGTVVPLLVGDGSLLTPVGSFVHVASNEGPFSTVIQGNGEAGGPVFTIDGSTAADRDDGVDRGRLVIEGLAFTGGAQGVRVNGGTGLAPQIEPVLNRLYIRDNGDGTGADDAGVLVEGAANPLIVNSSIAGNTGDGVRVDGAATDLTQADILHCTIVVNEDNGIFVATGNNARVRNTIVFNNGSGNGEGGIVFEDNPFIDPDSGPLDGLDPATGTPIQVTINGANFDQGGPTQVFFGPPAVAGTSATVNSQSDTQLVVDLPPAYNGVPGPVDVTIVRSDGMQIVVPNGFTYTAEQTGIDPAPVVWQADPGWGPVNTAGVTAYVRGAFFDKDCSVFFDFNDNGLADANELAPRVQWFSSGKLFVTVPQSAAAGKVDVLVRNNPSGLVSPKGPLKEFEYRTGFANPPPNIASIIPNSSSGTGGSITADVLGSNFQSGAIVKVGGIVCPYVTFTAGRLGGVTIPVSAFGGGGAYDVEVVNPDGLSDTLPNAFTYFPSSTPGLDAFPWRTSNFVQRGNPTALSLLGHGFDFNVDLVEPTVPTTFGPNIQPIAQREIPFNYPADTNGLGLAAGVSVVGINVMNSGTVTGGPSATPVATTNLIYAEPYTTLTPGPGRAVFFGINSVTIAAVGATDTIEMDIQSYRNSYNIFVGGVQVPPASITVITAPNPPGNYNGVIRFPAPAQPEGVFGPVDIRVESPDGQTENLTGNLLYTIAENAYSYRRTGSGQFPQISAVTPNTVPDNGTGPVRITGQNFIGPVASGVYSRVWLDGDGTFGNGNEIDLSTTATNYRIDSGSRIGFDTFDLDTADPGATLIPRDVPVDVVVEQFDAVNGVVLTDGVNPLRARLIGAITFQNAAAPPVIASVTPNSGPTGGVEAGGPPVIITGTDFGATQPLVLFGTSQARVTAFTATSITVDMPPAPNGLPGIYDVTVIRAADHIEATSVDAFTYYMDGAPTITQISPNHAQFDPASPPATPVTISITITGYNFDDEMRVTFMDNILAPTPETVELDTIADPGRIRVVSPNELTVQLTTDDLASILQAGDYTLDVANLGVTVQNQASIPSSDPAAASLTSSPRAAFFVYRDARGDVTVIRPELLYNDVYANNQDDYVNVTPGVGSISIDPVVLDSPWVGKLVPDSVTHPLLSTAGPFTEDPYTLVDFELEARPQGGGAEIGADEITDLNLGVCSWYMARITPNPVGVMPAGQLLVEIQYTGDCGGAPFIVPQGGDPRVVADRVPLRLYQNPGAGYYIYTNTNTISTLLEDRDGSTGPSANDLIADGHAAVYMQSGANIIGFEDNADAITAQTGYDHLTDGGIISGQAIRGRHFLIDTVPPRIYLEGYSAAGPLSITRLDVENGNVVVSSNDVITANDINLPAHPAGAPLATLPYRPSILPPPNAAYWPADDGAILFRDLDGVTPVEDGLQVFFNRGSISNPDPNPPGDVIAGATLDMSIQMTFIDPPVTDPKDPTQTPIAGYDFYTGYLNRQVAGFPLLTSTADDVAEAAGSAADENILLQGYGRWFLNATIALTNGTAKLAQYVTTGTGANQGVFDPALVPGDSIPSPRTYALHENDLLTATWSMTGLPPAVSQAWRLRAQFVGEDLAANATTNEATNAGATLYYRTLFDPLQLWWMYNVSSQLAGPSSGQAAPAPFFTVGLIGQRPSHTGFPYPAFTYKLYVSPASAGPYADSGIPWREWTLATAFDLLADLTPAQEAALNNQYVMIVSLGADEAGNVEPLLFDPTTVDVNALPPNARTFLFTNSQPADTAVGLELWYDLNGNGIIDGGEPVFGDNPIVPYSPFLRARYAVSVNSLGNAPGPFNVVWSFHEDGTQTVTSPPEVGPFQSNSDVIPVITPGPAPGLFITPSQNGGALGNSASAVTYLFTAAAYYTDGVNTIVDPTPASAYFVVVPAGVGQYVLSPENAGKQPIKEQGRE